MEMQARYFIWHKICCWEQDISSKYVRKKLIFGKIEEIICINKKETFAKFHLYETDQYVPALCGNKTRKTELTDQHNLNDIIDYKPITEKSTSATNVIILPDYCLKDVMESWTMQ